MIQAFNNTFIELLDDKKGKLHFEFIYFPDPMTRDTISFNNELLQKYFSDVDYNDEISFELLDKYLHVSSLDSIKIKLTDREYSLKEISTFHRVFMVYIPNITLEEYRNVIFSINENHKSFLMKNTIPIIVYHDQDNIIEIKKEQKMDHLLFLGVEESNLKLFKYNHFYKYGYIMIENERVSQQILYDSIEKAEYFGCHINKIITFIPKEKENIYSKAYPSMSLKEVKELKEIITNNWLDLGADEERPSSSKDLKRCFFDGFRRQFFKKFALSQYASPSFFYYEEICQFKFTKNQELKMKKSEKIYFSFFDPKSHDGKHALLELNTTSKFTKDLEKRLKNFEKDENISNAYDDIFDDLYSTVLIDLYLRFRSSVLYKIMIQAEKSNNFVLKHLVDPKKDNMLSISFMKKK